MHRDFEDWFARGRTPIGGTAPGGPEAGALPRVGGRPKAWGTPPISPINSDRAPAVAVDSSPQEQVAGIAETVPAPPVQDRPSAAQASSHSRLGGDAEDDVAAFFAARDAIRKR